MTTESTGSGLGLKKSVLDSDYKTEYDENIDLVDAQFASDGTVITIGVKFPASQSASADANTLDDYEEGTWTPELWDNTLATDPTPPTYTEQSGTYTKIGDLVFFSFQLQVSALGGLTAGEQAFIGGLPFTIKSGGYFGINVALQTGMSLPNNGIVMGRLNTANYIQLFFPDTTDGQSVLLISEFSNTGRIWASGFYRV